MEDLGSDLAVCEFELLPWGSVVTAQNLEPASDSVFLPLSLSAPPPLMRARARSLSLSQK